jgi:DNA polymerase-3 subunit gamma/tau
VLQTLAGFYRDLLIAKTAPQQSELVALTSDSWKQLCEIAQEWNFQEILGGQQHLQNSEAQVKHTTQPRLWLEVTLLGLLNHIDQDGETVPTTANQETETLPPPPSPQQSKTETLPKVESVETKKPEFPSSAPPQEKKESVETSVVSSSPATQEKQQPATATQEQSVEHSPFSSPSPASEEHKEPATVASSSASSSQTSQPASESVATGNEEQIWAQMLEKLPIPTKPLVRDHCRLLAIEGNLAQVGVRNKKLLAFAKKRQKDIEKALQTVCEQSLKVNFQVSGEFSTQSAPSSAPAETKQHESKPAHQEENGSKPAVSSPVEQEKTQQTETTETVDNPSSNLTIDNTSAETSFQAKSETSDNKTLEQVAKDLANAFKGDIVQFDQDDFSFLDNIDADSSQETTDLADSSEAEPEEEFDF